MEASEEKSPLAQAAEDLFNFGIDRESTKWLMANMPKEAETDRNTVEYELQILRIIGTGWAISYFLEDSPKKQELLALYWETVFEFSQTLSDTTGMMTGSNIDYFQVLRDRLDSYLEAISRDPEISDPALAIGPEFARICGNSEDIFTRMTGTKMFMNTMAPVRKYLEAVEL